VSRGRRVPRSPSPVMSPMGPGLGGSAPAAPPAERHVLDLLGQRRRHTHTTTPCVRKRRQGLAYRPRVSVMDPLHSNAAAQRERRRGVEHRQQRSRAHRRGMRSAALPPMGRLPHTFDRAGIAWLPTDAVTSGDKEASAGRRAPACPPPHTSDDRGLGSLAARCSCERATSGQCRSAPVCSLWPYFVGAPWRPHVPSSRRVDVRRLRGCSRDR
jgi:hypothetical protein